MRFDKMTIKSQELIQNAQSLASQYNNQQIEPEHLLAAMLGEPEGVAVAMLRKLDVSPSKILEEVETAIGRLPKVSGATEIYFSPITKKVLDLAFTEAANMKDALAQRVSLADSPG